MDAFTVPLWPKQPLDWDLATGVVQCLQRPPRLAPSSDVNSSTTRRQECQNLRYQAQTGTGGTLDWLGKDLANKSPAKYLSTRDEERQRDRERERVREVVSSEQALDSRHAYEYGMCRIPRVGHVHYLADT